MSADQLAEANTPAGPPAARRPGPQPLARLHRHRPSGRPLRRRGEADLVAVGWRHRPGHPAGRPRHGRRPADGRAGRRRPPHRRPAAVRVEAPADVVAVDEHVDLDDVPSSRRSTSPMWSSSTRPPMRPSPPTVPPVASSSSRSSTRPSPSPTSRPRSARRRRRRWPTTPSDEPSLDDLDSRSPSSYLDAVPEGDEFERGLQSLVSDELAPGPVEGAPGQLPTEPSTSGLSDADSVPGAFGRTGRARRAAGRPGRGRRDRGRRRPRGHRSGHRHRGQGRRRAELTAAGLVKRTPKKRRTTPPAAGCPSWPPVRRGASQRSPEEVRKMLSRYRSGLNKGRGGADGSSTDTTDLDP